MTEATPAPVPMAPAAKWNVLSIVSIITSFVGLHLVGIITGHISLGQIKKTGEQGKVLAIIGLVLGYIGLVVVIIIIIANIALLATVGTVTTIN